MVLSDKSYVKNELLLIIYNALYVDNELNTFVYDVSLTLVRVYSKFMLVQ